jgi:pimeloyl-ACP methyl ester carboxylesterase
MSLDGSARPTSMTTFVLIPGAGGAGWLWHRLAPELVARGHDAVTVDLPADDDGAGLAQYADTVLAAIGDRTDVVLVAQSMGAFTAPIVADRLGTARMIVLVNPMIPTTGETAGDWWENTGQPEALREHAERIGLEAAALDDPVVLFGHDVPADVWEAGAEHQRDQSGTPFGETWPLDAWPDVPTRVLVGHDDRLFPPELQRRVARERLGITPDEMPGGHLLPLSRPDELADRLVAYVTSAELSGSGTASRHRR